MDDKALTNLFEVFGSDTDLREIHLFLKTDSEKFEAQSKDFRSEIGQVYLLEQTCQPKSVVLYPPHTQIECYRGGNHREITRI
jgi:hypothetical protein